MDDASALLLVQPQSSSNTTCTCGAGEELDAERQRIVQLSHELAERGENLLLQETELEQRVLELECRKEAFAATVPNLRKQHDDIEAKIEEAESIFLDAAEIKKHAQVWEKRLEEQAEQLEFLELETQTQEEAVAQEELSLIGERNAAEEELETLRNMHAAVDSEASAHERQGDADGLRVAEIDRELIAVDEDELLLNEIEAQLEPILMSLEAREVRLLEEERLLEEREIEFQEQEEQLQPAWQQYEDQLRVAQERARELSARQAESEQQHRRLLDRQKHLSGAETDLQNLEDELQYCEDFKDELVAATSPTSSFADGAHRQLIKLP